MARRRVKARARSPCSTLRLLVRSDTDREQREHALTEWYRDELRREAQVRVAQWSSDLDIEIAEWRIRRMRTKWGSCNAEARRIWLNLELANKTPVCLDYIIVHELLHLTERTHSKRFEHLLDDAMPKWRAHRDELYRLPLAHEQWPRHDGRPTS